MGHPLSESWRRDLGRLSKAERHAFVVQPVTGSEFRTGAQLVDRRALGLRAGDALHLAVASRHGAVLRTLDRRLADAGPQLGMPSQLLG